MSKNKKTSTIIADEQTAINKGLNDKGLNSVTSQNIKIPKPTTVKPKGS